MTLSLVEIAGTNFTTSRDADELNTRLMAPLGAKSRYVPARLAIARSLAVSAPPPIIDVGEDPGKPIKGDTLFGTGADLTAWTALIVEHAGRPELGRKDLVQLTACHWKRGIEILNREWLEAEEQLPRFLARMAENAGLRAGARTPGAIGNVPGEPIAEPRAVPVRVRIGEIGTNLADNTVVEWAVNGPAGSPHVAVMGAVGSGKTRTASSLLLQIHAQAGTPVILFDLKGDISQDRRLTEAFGATVIDVSKEAVPLDVLASQSNDDREQKLVAARFMESFSRVKTERLGGNQRDALRDATNQALRTRKPCRIEDVRDALRRVYQQRNMKPDAAMATFNQLCEFNHFDPQMSPAEFFRRSWILGFPTATEDSRRLVSYLILDSLDRWLNGLEDSKLDEDRNRALRILIVIDEAHRLLGFKQEALSNLVRQSRSKGGVVMLISQKPDDFDNEDNEFVGEVGLFACFKTNARPGPAKRILEERNLADLPDGVCVARIGGKPPLRIQAWQPSR